jgi:Mn2+/Fe2+ NRAMP family transporter
LDGTFQVKDIARFYYLILPGVLTAMTGVGVGDLATAGYAGANLGIGVLWAVLFGAVLKFVLSEGIARWQLATGGSLLHGAIEHLRWPFIAFLLVYFFPWCWFVGGALINAAGAAGSHLFALAGIELSKTVVGTGHTLLALALILVGGQRLFNPLMSILAVLLFVCVLVCAFIASPAPADIFTGLLPSMPDGWQALSWTVALIGGVGGTLTIVCYGYWIVDSGRSGRHGLGLCRIDLSLSYALTALFGVSMVIIGSAVGQQQGRGLGLLLGISRFFAAEVHPLLGLMFLVGAWAAIFSSLLGVWQVVPQVFADCVHTLRGSSVPLERITVTGAYRFWLLVLALVPILSLEHAFRDVQKMYAIVGAFFMPVLAAALLWLNRSRFVSTRFANTPAYVIALVIVLVFFSYAGYGVIGGALS